MARPSFNGQPATASDLYKVLDYYDEKIETHVDEIDARLVHLETWKVEMETINRILRWTLGASGAALVIGVFNLILAVTADLHP